MIFIFENCCFALSPERNSSGAVSRPAIFSKLDSPLTFDLISLRYRFRTFFPSATVHPFRPPVRSHPSTRSASWCEAYVTATFPFIKLNVASSYLCVFLFLFQVSSRPSRRRTDIRKLNSAAVTPSNRHTCGPRGRHFVNFQIVLRLIRVSIGGGQVGLGGSFGGELLTFGIPDGRQTRRFDAVTYDIVTRSSFILRLSRFQIKSHSMFA